MRIDQFNRVIFQLLGQTDFSGAEIVIADAGCQMMKGTRAFRAQLPEWVGDGVASRHRCMQDMVWTFLVHCACIVSRCEASPVLSLMMAMSSSAVRVCSASTRSATL